MSDDDHPRLSKVRCENAVIGVFAVAFVYLLLYTIPDYGMIWDAWEYYVGDKNLHFYRTLDPEYFDFQRDDIAVYQRPRHPDFHGVTNAYRDVDALMYPHLIWPVGPTSSSLTKYALFAWTGLFDPIDAHHVALVGWGLVLVVAMYFFALQGDGFCTAFCAVVCLASYPRFWAHLHNNIKDVPMAAVFALVIFAFHRGVTGGRWRLILLSAGLWGLGLATKANALFLPFILGPWFFYVLWQRRRDESPALPRKVVWALVAFPFVGLLVMFLAWPMLLVDFPANLVLYAKSLAARGYQGEAGWQWMPLVNAVVTMPILVLLLLLAGLGSIGWTTWRERRLGELHLLILLWLIVPVLRVMLPGARDFDVIRHWLEVVPAIALLAGIGLTCVRTLNHELLRRVTGIQLPEATTVPGMLCIVLVVFVFFSPIIAWDVRYHPNQIAFYNCLVGGLPGAQARGLPESTDYWANSYRQGFEWLNDNATENARLVVGVAEHLAFYVHQTWLRQDIQLLPLTGVSPELLRAGIAQYSKTGIYLMYVTREDWYHSVVQYYDARVEPVHEIRVEGASILNILRLEPPETLPPAP